MRLMFGGFQFDLARSGFDEEVKLPCLLAGAGRVIKRAEIREDRSDGESRFLLHFASKRREQVFTRVHGAARKLDESAHKIGWKPFEKQELAIFADDRAHDQFLDAVLLGSGDQLLDGVVINV